VIVRLVDIGGIDEHPFPSYDGLLMSIIISVLHGIKLTVKHYVFSEILYIISNNILEYGFSHRSKG
jgi:hypothetical protein